MIRRAVAFLYRTSEPVVISTKEDAGTVRTALAAAIRTPRWLPPNEECVVGRVGSSEFTARRMRPWVGNSFAPILHGSIGVAGSAVTITYRFRVAVWTRLFAGLWFTFIGIWTLMSFTVLFSAEMSLGLRLVFPAGGVGMIFLGAGIVLGGRRFGSSDVPYLVDQMITLIKGSTDDRSRLLEAGFRWVNS